MSALAAVEPAAERKLEAPAKAANMEAGAAKPTKAERIFTSMRAQIAEVFPDTDDEAWSYESENYEIISIDRPETEFAAWVEETYDGSDEFTQLFTRRMFMVWDELEQSGFVANEKEMWEHQKALFAWAALNICTGTREEAKLLIRSPYGSGKSLINGLIAKAFREAQLDLMLRENVAPNKLPTGAFIARKREHLVQNVGGPQHSIVNSVRPERSEMNAHWKDLAAMFGEDFTKFFPRPTTANHPFYDLFRPLDPDDEPEPVADRIKAYLAVCLDGDKKKQFGKVKTRRVIVATLTKLANGDIVLIPNFENVPEERASQLSSDHETEASPTLQGDSGFAFEEGVGYHIKTSHKQTAPDKDTYSARLDEDGDHQFMFVDGTALTRPPDRIRQDIAFIAARCRLLLLDEAGYYNPDTVSDSVQQLSNQDQIVIGVTGQDRGIAGCEERDVGGWKRSPTISEAQMIKMGLMKSVAYQSFGDTENPASPGSQEAWQQYRDIMFEPVQTADTLGLPQPHEVDKLVVVKGARVHQYAKNIALAHAEMGIPVEVYCFHAGLGAKKQDMLKAFNAPKKDGDPLRIMVGVDTMLSDALTFPNIGCIDIVDNVYRYPRDQLRGRFGHIRNLPGEDEDEHDEYLRSVARTYFREQVLHKGQDSYLRTAAKDQGYADDISDEDAKHIPLRIMIDSDGYREDWDCEDLSEPEPLPDTPTIQRRKHRAKGIGALPAFVGEPLDLTNPVSIEKEKKRLESQRKRLAAREQKKREEHEAIEQALLDAPSKQPATTPSTAGSAANQSTLAPIESRKPAFQEPPRRSPLSALRGLVGANQSFDVSITFKPEEPETDEANNGEEQAGVKKKKTKKKKKKPEPVTESATIDFDSEGIPSRASCEALLAGFSAGNLIGSLMASIFNYHRNDALRGQELADRVFQRAVGMGLTAERRRRQVGDKTTSKNIGVKQYR